MTRFQRILATAACALALGGCAGGHGLAVGGQADVFESALRDEMKAGRLTPTEAQPLLAELAARRAAGAPIHDLIERARTEANDAEVIVGINDAPGPITTTASAGACFTAVESVQQAPVTLTYTVPAPASCGCCCCR